jgi:hypothetical protein
VELIGQQGVGDEVSLEVQRGSTRMTVQATLDSRQ